MPLNLTITELGFSSNFQVLLSAKEHTLEWTHKDGLPYFIFTVISPLMRKLHNRMFQKHLTYTTAHILSKSN
jgi:hypothetical protein